jgi:signal transduction histidine kinase
LDVNFSLTCDKPTVNADPIQIEQVLLNLIRNAIEAMADSDSMPRKLTICTSVAKSGQVELSISDNGHGIDNKYAQQIFDPFFTTKSDGLGIGLSISRSIVEAHGGTLSAKSNPDGGSTFKFTLPITK